ncbi:putative aaa family protein [Lasiodiplodia theobromae]|uniref:Uncharacterized protein n=1 Tax=Lasiodiplodia theobromae TaxID=45133 RepID=A0A5N5CYH0_9PEZI|nr:AAA family ATPAse [Lasiodiplodia theobromae]KAB2570391.1 hypothetical protein DBV05_g10925 [Lasiodiplodia theobromae]KAF4543039.1 AAA family ATPAse [Lasiodiplodia theobromae]KAF9635611.1 putative aaa family protein [Lasiodiplodia theobromae]
MIRQKPSAAMQKTYDDCYLVCSTAVYFESQGNESEALRSWRNALDQIYYFNAYRRPANWAPKTETEKTLQSSLRELELQCKERVDLLEALKESRKDAKKEKATVSASASVGDLQASSDAASRPEDGPGWLGEGTIPPVNYPDLARPPPLPKRPSFPKARSSEGPGEERRNVEDAEANAKRRKEGLVIIASIYLEGKAPGSGKGGNAGLGLHFWPEQIDI